MKFSRKRVIFVQYKLRDTRGIVVLAWFSTGDSAKNLEIVIRVRERERGRSAGWHFRTRDDCRCNHRNSCSVDVRSDVFEEDPCPGTGKYIEAHYQCLGWFTFFYSDVVFARLWIYAKNLKGFAFRSRTAEEPHDLGTIIWGTKRIYFVLWVDYRRYTYYAALNFFYE